MLPTETYIKLLRDYISAQQSNYGFGDAESLLEMIYAHYNEWNDFDNQSITDGFEELYARISGLSLRDMDKIIDVVCALCSDHEKAGFIEGIKLGIRLDQELSS